MGAITAKQVRELWDSPNMAAAIDRGDDYAPVTKDDLDALAGQIDTDDDGYPLDGQWEVLADQLNSDVAGGPSSSAGDAVLAELANLRQAMNQREDEFFRAQEDLHDLIRTAVNGKDAPVTSIASAAGYSRERIYQIRDGRR